MEPMDLMASGKFAEMNYLMGIVHAKMMFEYLKVKNPDGITNEYLPHALEWEMIHYPAPWSVGN